MEKFNNYPIKMLSAVNREQITFVQKNTHKRDLLLPLAGGEYRRLLGFGFEPQHLYVFHDSLVEPNDYVLFENRIWKYLGDWDNGIVTLESLTGAKIGVHHDNMEYGKLIATTDESLNLRCDCGHLKQVFSGLCSHCGRFSIIKEIPSIPKWFKEYFISEYNNGRLIQDVSLKVEERVLIPKEHLLTGSDVEKECMENPFYLPKTDVANQVQIFKQ